MYNSLLEYIVSLNLHNFEKQWKEYLEDKKAHQKLYQNLLPSFFSEKCHIDIYSDKK